MNPNLTDEAGVFLGLFRFVGQAQQIAGVDGDPSLAAVGEGDRFATFAADRDRPAQYGTCGGGAEGDRDARADEHLFLFDPPAAGLDFAGVGFGVDAALAALFELEVLHRIGDVDAGAVDLGFGDGAVEDLPGGAHERRAGEVLLIARLFADEHQRRIDRAFAEDGLCRMLVEVAAGAGRGLFAQRRPGGGGIVADRRRLA